jgi:6-phosphogluconolactonase
VADGAGPEIVVVADAGAASLEAARRIAEALAAADAERRRADWATTGGSSVVGIYRALTETALMELMPWPRLNVWWGDERYVPRDHPLSNAKPFDDIVAGIALGEEGTAGGGWPGEPLPVDQIHPFLAGEGIATGRGPGWAASAMADELRAQGPALDGEGWPILDVLLLGVGPDGHILSVFPGSPALGAADLAMAISAPTHIEPHVERLTLNPAVVGAARHVVVVATGSAKATVLGEVFGSTRDPSRWPAQLALRSGATWILDADAAANLPSAS